MDQAGSALLNNREIAVVAWVAIALLWGGIVPGIRKALRRFARSLLNKHILTIFAISSTYVVGCVIALERVGLWTLHQLKATLIWALSVGVISWFRVDKETDRSSYFATLLKDSLRITVVLESIISYYTFSLPVELVIVPGASLLLLMTAFAEREEKHKALAKVLNGVQVAFGSIVLVNALYRLVHDFQGFANQSNLSEFSVPITLSIMYIPFLYGLSVFLSYERGAVRMRQLFKSAQGLLPGARRRAIYKFRTDTRLFTRWLKIVQARGVHSEKDVDDSFELLRDVLETERAPPKIPHDIGWSPHNARSFLERMGLKAGHYHPLYDSKWLASSTALELTEGVFGSSVNYYIEGTKDVATSLSLELTVYEQEQAEESLRRFALLSDELHKAAIRAPMLDEELYAILTRQDANYVDTERVVSIRHRPWPNSGKMGFDVEVQMRVPNLGELD